MPVALYFDVHVPQAIADQLRLRGVDVISAVNDDSATLEDDALLEHASDLGRVLFTQDIRFKALAESWRRQCRIPCSIHDSWTWLIGIRRDNYAVRSRNSVISGRTLNRTRRRYPSPRLI